MEGIPIIRTLKMIQSTNRESERLFKHTGNASSATNCFDQEERQILIGLKENFLLLLLLSGSPREFTVHYFIIISKSRQK